MASWLVGSTSERMVRARDLAGDIVLCSLAWARHFTPSVPPTSRCVNGYQRNAGGNPAMD